MRLVLFITSCSYNNTKLNPWTKFNQTFILVSSHWPYVEPNCCKEIVGDIMNFFSRGIDKTAMMIWVVVTGPNISPKCNRLGICAVLHRIEIRTVVPLIQRFTKFTVGAEALFSFIKCGFLMLYVGVVHWLQRRRKFVEEPVGVFERLGMYLWIN